jgi:hypothetical protein
MRPNKPVPPKGRQRFAFLVDGECEFWYIQMLKRNERINVNLEPKIPQKKELPEQYKRVIELSNDYDKVFWIIDFDVINAETKLAKKRAKTALQELKEYRSEIEKNYKENIVIIINNPCLEFWYLLHFEATSRYYENGDKVIKQLKKYLSGYEKTQKFYTKQDHDIYLKLKPCLPKAIENTRKLKSFDFDNPQSGMTQMQLFFKEINP